LPITAVGYIAELDVTFVVVNQCGRSHYASKYRVVQKSGHPRNSMGVRFFGPPCK